MDTIVGLKEVRENINRFVKGVEKGRSFLVVRKAKPLFRLTPLEKQDEEWEEVIDFTKIKKGGIRIKEILSRL